MTHIEPTMSRQHVSTCQSREIKFHICFWKTLLYFRESEKYLQHIKKKIFMAESL